MTKDGRRSRITDIRYFHGDKHAYLEGHQDAVAFGRRMAWFLNGEDFSLGAYTALYIFLDAALEQGVVQVTDAGGDWWQRYTNIGVTPDLLDRDDASQLVMSGTVAALRTIRPDLSLLVDRAEQVVRLHGGDLRFLLKSRQTRRFVVDVSFSIATWPQSSSLFVSLTDRVTGAFLEAPPEPLQFYLEAFDLAGNIGISEAAAAISPNASVGATLTSLRHGGKIVKNISEFLPASRPAQSKLVKLRG